jgi:acetyl esterase/lipase
MGDSAGGALALAVALALRDTGDRTPARVVALSPWLDATLDEPAVADLEATDPMLAETGLRAAGRWWAGAGDPSDPLVSPVNARLTGLPPIDVFIGDRDILRPAVDELARRAGLDAADLHVWEVSSMFHVWMTRAIPEGRRTRRQLADLVRRSG